MTAVAAPPLVAPRFEAPPDDAPGWPGAPAATRVMVVAPGPMFSTKDVWDGAVNGLRALGVDVLPIDYHNDLRAVGALERAREEAGEAADERSFREYTLYASHRAVATALAYRPHLILFISGTVFPPPAAGLLGQHTRTALWLTESPYQAEQEEYVQAFYPTVFTNERAYVARLRAIRRARGHPRPDAVHYLPHAYDPARHAPRDPREAYPSDVCFIGSPFPERQELLGGVNWGGIDARLLGVWADRDVEETMAGPTGAVPNAEAHRYYAGAAININHHRRIRYYGRDDRIAAGEAESLNPRVYELAAAGAFQVCDDTRPELGELFGDSIPTYRDGDSADLERVIRHWLARPAERRRLAAEARRRAHPHRVANRMRFALDTCLGKDG